jgi:hypothetical protein
MHVNGMPSSSVIDWSGIVRALVTRVRRDVDAALTGADGHLDSQLDTGTNTLGWLAWHLSRSYDRNASELVGREQLWIAERWHERFGRPPDPDDTGYRANTAQLAGFRSPSIELLIGYNEAATARVLDYFDHATPDELARVTVSPTLHNRATAAERIVGFVVEGLEHAGQMELLRGVLDRRLTT